MLQKLKVHAHMRKYVIKTMQQDASSPGQQSMKVKVESSWGMLVPIN
jgi:hypothetical protein